jgi:hypothetical protein
MRRQGNDIGFGIIHSFTVEFSIFFCFILSSVSVEVFAVIQFVVAVCDG